MKLYFKIQIPLITFLTGLLLGTVFFNYLAHESFHAIGCLLFGIPFSFSFFQVVPLISVAELPAIIIGLMGGIGTAMCSLLAFLLANHLENKSDNWFLNMLGFQIAFLALIIIGITNALLEGLFYKSYLNIFNNTAILLLLTTVAIIFSFLIIYKLKIKKLNSLRIANGR